MKKMIPIAAIAVLFAGAAMAGSATPPQVDPDMIVSTMNGSGGVDHLVPLGLFLLGLLTFIGGAVTPV